MLTRHELMCDTESCTIWLIHVLHVTNHVLFSHKLKCQCVTNSCMSMSHAPMTDPCPPCHAVDLLEFYQISIWRRSLIGYFCRKTLEPSNLMLPVTMKILEPLNHMWPKILVLKPLNYTWQDSHTGALKSCVIWLSSLYAIKILWQRTLMGYFCRTILEPLDYMWHHLHTGALKSYVTWLSSFSAMKILWQRNLMGKFCQRYWSPCTWCCQFSIESCRLWMSHGVQ